MYLTIRCLNFKNNSLGEMVLGKTIYVINGPNLNLLGTRETNIYGNLTLSDIERMTYDESQKHHFTLKFIQSNKEGEIVDWIQDASKEAKGIIINAAGYTHTSISIMDALLACNIPIIELHISNIYKREDFRKHSYISEASTGIICGFGPNGYIMAVNAMANILNNG